MLVHCTSVRRGMATLRRTSIRSSIPLFSARTEANAAQPRCSCSAGTRPILRENVENHAVPVEKKPTFFLPPIVFALFLHSQKRTLCICGNDSVAQLVEQYTFNVWVLGSSPSGITKNLHNAL